MTWSEARGTPSRGAPRSSAPRRQLAMHLHRLARMFACAGVPVSDRTLSGTNGTLVVDAYTGYNATCTPEQRERAGCPTHLRRKFHDAQSSAPEAAAEAMRLILAVYRVEHEAKRLGVVRTPAHAWLLEQKPQHLPKSPMGGAISYALGQWPALQVFLENPAVPIGNNASERALRIVAFGRKNFRFVGNDVAGQNLAVLMSLVRSCEAVGVKPLEYLADVLMRVQDRPAAPVEELLPELWNAAWAWRSR